MRQPAKSIARKVIYLFLYISLQSTHPAHGQTTAHSQTPAIINLKCEYLTNPLGIDNPNPRITWQLRDAEQDIHQTVYQILVGTDSAAVANGHGNTWASGTINNANNLITYNGIALQPFTKYYWTVVAETNKDHHLQSSVASFETGMMSQYNWKGAWISDGESIHVKPAPYFRKVFPVTKKILSARAYISAAGLYELYLNGKRIGDHQLDPMFTRFDRRNLYVTYDVTQILQEGRNAVGVLLGNGWYNFQTMAVWDYERAPWRSRPAFCLDLRITYDDGSVETVTSDQSWKTALSPLVYNSIYTGEQYDARKELPGWNTVNFDDGKWHRAKYRESPSNNIVAQTLWPIRHVEKLQPVSVTRTSDTSWLYDFGRNIAGISELTIAGDSNTRVRVSHAERLDKKGKIDQSNVDYFLSAETRSDDPFATDSYRLSGKGRQTFTPRFSYKGFRYAEVTSSRPLSLGREDLVAWSMHSDVPAVGKITTSSDLINKIYAATNASYLANLFGYPTDCPQREKNGWTGDAHIASETGLYNFDAITIYEKWLADLRDEQQP
ncbi:MAG TPA: family 78 glycoside hydrolase catalytic domain, partial [Puia sp.]|nr:family 78 glycoside hydrolase catalytic domain [Puia sp.]